MRFKDTLPPLLLVTPDPGTMPFPFFLRSLEQSLLVHRRGMDIDHAAMDARSPLIVLLRAPNLDATAYNGLLAAVRPLCNAAHAKLMSHIDGMRARLPTDLAVADGVHLNSRALQRYARRPIAPSFLLSAACHNAAELEQAVALGVDFVTLSPVMPTQTHPDAPPLGWAQFAALCATVSVPVYGMGGLSRADLPRVQAAGGYGIAAIRSLWHASESKPEQRSE